MLHREFDRLRKEDGEEFYSDYETRERLLAPFILIALSGSNKSAVPINVSSLEKNFLMDSLIPDSSQPLLGMIITGEPMYAVLSADGHYIVELPNLLDMEYDVLEIKGYIGFEAVRKNLPNIHVYFNPGDREPVPDDNIPF